jgi:hypothetical protein
MGDVHVSRRTFLMGSAALAALVSGGTVGLTPSISGAAQGSRLTRSTFLPLVNASLKMSNGSHTHAVVLSSISDLPTATTQQSEHCFSLLFEAPAGTKLPQAVRTLSHADLGDVPLLVVPVDRGKVHQMYQVIINSPHQTVKNPAGASGDHHG